MIRNFTRSIYCVIWIILLGFSGLPNDIDDIMQRSIRNRAFPGASLAIGNQFNVIKERGYGTLSYTSAYPINTQTKYDLASLTKVIATTSAVMKLYEQGKLDLNARVASYLPEFANNGKESITIRHLMTHTGGLKPYYRFYEMGISDKQGVVQFIMNCRPDRPSGQRMEYSDLDLILMQLVIEKITQQSLDAYLQEQFWNPLGMNNTGFRNVGTIAFDPTIPPTEADNYFRRRTLQGEVHDETAWIMGGVAGHAGLFSTAADLRKYATFMLNEGITESGVRLLQPETIRFFTTAQNPIQHSRAIGWDTKSSSAYSSAGKLFSNRSYGHTGFTGTSIWIDPDSKYYVILLTNRVNPTRNNRKIADVRVKVADAAYNLLRNSQGQRNNTSPPRTATPTQSPNMGGGRTWR